MPSTLRSLVSLGPCLFTAAAVAIGCREASPEDLEASESDMSAVAGEYQARLRATTGEEAVLGFDASWEPDPRRPECTSLVADRLRVRLYDNVSTAPRANATIETFVRGRTVTYHKDEEASPGRIDLPRLNAVSYGADVLNVVVARRCSGEPLEYAQRYSFAIGERVLVDPVGDKPTFWTRLSEASRTGISATSNHVLDLRATDGTTIAIAFRKLRGDDPDMPRTCERTDAVPLRIAVETATPASVVAVEVQSSWRTRTTTSSVSDPGTPGWVPLTKDGPSSFSLELAPLTIDGRCSGEQKVYTQSLKVIVDGVPLIDPIGDKPLFVATLATVPMR